MQPHRQPYSQRTGKEPRIAPQFRDPLSGKHAWYVLLEISSSRSEEEARALIDAGAVFAAMSGSGSAVFGLFERAEAARRTASRRLVTPSFV